MKQDYTNEQQYIKAKKRVKDIKGFYIHFALYIATIPITIIVNLLFVPSFHFFWLSIFGWGVAIVLHWLTVFGFKNIGFGKDWEEKKIKEIIEEYNQPKK